MSSSLGIVSSALDAFREFTGDPDVQVQVIQVFIKIVLSGKEAYFDDIEKSVGITQGAVSRNIKKMVTGPRGTPNFSLIEVFLDPHDARRRIIKLSPRGKALAAHMEAKMMPGLVRYAKEVKEND